MIEPSIVDHYVILGALVGAIVWNVVTWYYGDTVVVLARADRRARGRGCGEGRLCRAGRQAASLVITLAIVGSPLLGFLLGMGLMVIVAHLSRALRAESHRSLVSPAAVRFGVDVQSRPRRQRRTENHGYHRHGAVFRA